MPKEIKPNQVYTTKEASNFLKVSQSTIKRLLKKGAIRANKVGAQYRILGRELLRVVSPEAEERAVGFYKKIKEKTKKAIEKW